MPTERQGLTNPKDIGAQRYVLRVGHSDDAGLGSEGWVVRMSDHFSSCETAQKWVKSEDYEALRQRFERACQRVTELEGNAPEPSEVRETGWLVENGKSGSDIRYRTMTHGMGGWTTDSRTAIRFARRQDAEMFAQDDEDAWAIVEHQWITPPAEPTPQYSCFIEGCPGKHVSKYQVCAAAKSNSSQAESILDRKVIVCAACLCASCWQGEFYCEHAKTAGTVEKTVRELFKGNVREDSGYWFKNLNTGEVDYDAKSAAKRAWLAEQR
jgi:hypothetical protein